MLDVFSEFTFIIINVNYFLIIIMFSSKKMSLKKRYQFN